MKTYKVNSIISLINSANKKSKNSIVLFRGQPGKYPLLPKIARIDPSKNIRESEEKMLEEFKRRGFQMVDKNIKNDIDLLCYAQHFGMSTRLLDWTTNPLIATFFACQNQNDHHDSYVYRLVINESSLFSKNTNRSPFDVKITRILKPIFSNQRIIAQNGYFTVHAYSEKNQKFISLENNNRFINKITEFIIPQLKKKEIIDQLDTLGINYSSVFPDIEGISKHINWLFSF
jgi:hypothetical protein